MTRAMMQNPSDVKLTPRWTTLPRIKKIHRQYFECDSRYIVAPAGRRSYKTEIAKRKLTLRAMSCTDDAAWFVEAAPTRDQAKKIFWPDLKAMIPSAFIHDINESTLTVTLITGTKVSVVGMDRPQRIEGSPLNGIILDEFGNMRPETWTEHVRPALSDQMMEERKPFAWFIGVPEGRNHYYDLYVNALADTTGQWQTFTWPSSLVIAPEEVEAAKRDLDPNTYEQEYEASFITSSGRVYYRFGEWNISKEPLPYDADRPLIFAFDFNLAPGVAAILQEYSADDDDDETQTHVIGEVWIEKNSNTPLVCRKLIADWGKHRGDVYLYGDPTGGAAGSAKVMGSDWDLINSILQGHFGLRIEGRVSKGSPPVRPRINAVNSRLKAMDETVHLLVDAAKAPHVVKDFDGVAWKTGAADEIEKEANSTLTHVSDAIGYYLERAYPIARHTTISTAT